VVSSVHLLSYPVTVVLWQYLAGNCGVRNHRLCLWRWVAVVSTVMNLWIQVGIFLADWVTLSFARRTNSRSNFVSFFSCSFELFCLSYLSASMRWKKCGLGTACWNSDRVELHTLLTITRISVVLCPFCGRESMTRTFLPVCTLAITCVAWDSPAAGLNCFEKSRPSRISLPRPSNA
jgi:hypothetical protein